jgi:hypothetical protein
MITFFEITGGGSGWGIFTWSLFFTWGNMPERISSKYNIQVNILNKLQKYNKKIFREIS